MKAILSIFTACRRTADVRFWSKADICVAKSYVRFASNRDRKSGFPQKGVSALPPESGHVRCNYRCPLWANSKHYGNSSDQQKITNRS
jgi:hypothetical protein